MPCGFSRTTAVLALMTVLLSCGKPGEKSPAGELPLITTKHELVAAFEQAGNRMVVLDLYADWCMPCKVLSPTLAELAGQNRHNAAFYRINVDKSPDLARAFGVRGIPYVVFLKHHKAVYALSGVNPRGRYQKILDVCKNVSSPDECVGRLNERL